MANFGERFKTLRTSLGKTQEELARDFNKKYFYNYGKSSISLYENNKRIPEMNALEAWANYFNVSTDYLLGRDDKKNIESFNIRLKRLRSKNNMTKEELAGKLNVSEDVVEKLETGERKPDYKIVNKVANCFNVTVDYLLCNTDKENPVDKKVIKLVEEGFVEKLVDLTEEQRDKILEYAAFLKMLEKKY